MNAPATLPLSTRLWFAWLCFFRVLFDGAYAASVSGARSSLPGGLVAKSLPETPKAPAPTIPPAPPADAALQLLGILQREGRLVDFLEQDIASFSDADIGAAARVVHDGCRKALRTYAKVAPLRTEEEGARVTLDAGFEPAEVKLSGNVQGVAPYTGTLRHRGWRATEVSLPVPVKGYDARVLAPAEVEL